MQQEMKLIETLELDNILLKIKNQAWVKPDFFVKILTEYKYIYIIKYNENEKNEGREKWSKRKETKEFYGVLS